MERGYSVGDDDIQARTANQHLNISEKYAAVHWMVLGEHIHLLPESAALNTWYFTGSPNSFQTQGLARMV